MLKVGYIGLGLMGKSIARNILKAGFPLVVFNRSTPAVDELVHEGASAAHSAAEVASLVDIVFTNLPDSPDVEKVALGERGIIEGAHPGLIFVDNSTIKPASARMIAEKLSAKGVLSLDAPVSGGDACLQGHGQDRYACRRCRRGPGGEGRQSDHGRGADGRHG